MIILDENKLSDDLLTRIAYELGGFQDKTFCVLSEEEYQ